MKLPQQFIKIRPSLKTSGELYIFPFRIVWFPWVKNISFQIWLGDWKMIIFFWGKITYASQKRWW